MLRGVAALAVVVHHAIAEIPAALLVFSSVPIVNAEGRLQRALMWLGTVSYSLYLTHGFVMTTYARLIKPGTRVLPPAIGVFAAVFCSLLPARLTYGYVESPLNKILKALWVGRRRPIAVQPA